MEYKNSTQLSKWLKDASCDDLAGQEVFILDDDQFNNQLLQLTRNKVRPDHLHDRTAFRCLTLSKTRPAPAPKSIDLAPLHDHIRQQNKRDLDMEVRLKDIGQKQDASVGVLKDVVQTVVQKHESQDVKLSDIDSKLELLDSSIKDMGMSLDVQFNSSEDQFKAVQSSLEQLLNNVNRPSIVQCGHSDEIKGIANSIDEIKAMSNVVKVDRADTVGTVSTMDTAINKQLDNLTTLSKMNRWIMFAILILLILLLLSKPAHAQQGNSNPAVATAACGGESLSAGSRTALTTDLTGDLCINGTGISVSITTAGLATSAKQDTGNTSLGTLAGAIGSGKSLVNLQQINGTTINAQSLGAATLSTAGSGMVIDNFNYYGDGTPMLSTDTGKVSIASGQVASGAFAAGAMAAQSFTVGAIPPAAGILVSGVTAVMTATTSTVVVAAAASNYLYITSCSTNNTHASVDTLINLQDGSGGTVLWTFTGPHGWGGESHSFGGAPLKVPTLGNGLYAVDVTTGASVIVSCQGFKSTVSY